VTLFGITLRNSIMMISHYEHMVGTEGVRWGPAAAIAGAGDRLAPILMTSIVTAFGLLPLAIGMNEPGREIEGPMALVIVGGLATSMALNLLVLPTLALQFGKFGGTSDPDVAAPAEPTKLRSIASPHRLPLLGSDAHRVRLLEQPLAHQIDMHPQMVELVREIERIANAAHTHIDALDFGLIRGELALLRRMVEVFLQCLELAVPIEEPAPHRP
jgi:hypothetical protein